MNNNESATWEKPVFSRWAIFSRIWYWVQILIHGMRTREKQSLNEAVVIAINCRVDVFPDFFQGFGWNNNERNDHSLRSKRTTVGIFPKMGIAIYLDLAAEKSLVERLCVVCLPELSGLAAKIGRVVMLR